VKKVLLHICCGPCGIFPYEALAGEGFFVKGFFYNPNIQPCEEYQKRLEAIGTLERHCGIEVERCGYEEEAYRDAVSGSLEKKDRCGRCFELRLKKAFAYAQDNGFDYVTTTLLVSPYQDQQLIGQIGERLSANAPVKFLFRDFRPGFRQAHRTAREKGFYLQNYCGCLASLKERQEEKGKKKNVQC